MRIGCFQLLMLGLSLAAAPSAFSRQSGTEPPEFTVSELVVRVLDGNRDLKAAIASLSAAQAATAASRALPNPKLDFGGGRSSPRVGSGLQGSVHSVGASQLLEFGSVRSARFESALAEQRGTEFAIARVRNDLAARIRIQAYEILLRQEEASAAHEALRLLDEVRERIRVRVESGEAPRYEIIKADAEIIGARQRRDAARLQVQKSVLEVNRIAGGALPESWSLKARLDDPLPAMSIEVLRREMTERSPELAELQADIDRARARLYSARASRWPGVEVRVDHSREPDLVQNRLGLSVSVPLLDDRAPVIEQASIELSRAQQVLEGRRNELMQEMLLAWKELELAAGAVEALGVGAVREAEAALRVAEAAYRFGERGILEVLDAQRVLRSVRFDLLQARFRLQSAKIVLEQLAARYM